MENADKMIKPVEKKSLFYRISAETYFGIFSDLEWWKLMRYAPRMQLFIKATCTPSLTEIYMRSCQ